MSDSEDEIGPLPPSIGPQVPTDLNRHKKSKTNHISDILTSNLPTAALYEFSYMHQSAVSRVLVSTQTEFIMTISGSDGILKFWKKQTEGIEFVKAYVCGSSVVDAAVSTDGLSLAIISSRENELRVYDIANFNLISCTSVFPNRKISTICFVSSSLLAVAQSDAGTVLLMDTDAIVENPKTYKAKEFRVHEAPVCLLKYSIESNCVVSIDTDGFMELWDPITLSTPSICSFESKFDTDLFELKKDDTKPVSLCVSSSHFAVMTSAGLIKIFRLKNAKLIKVIDESLDTLMIAQNDPLQRAVHLDAKDLTSRVEREPTVEAIHAVRNSMVFDHESGDVLMYATIVGIKIFHIKTNVLLGVLGKVESTERFVDIVLYQGQPKLKVQELTAGGAPELRVDPTLVCTSLDSDRFFLFTQRLPGDHRDIFNEPTAEERSASVAVKPRSRPRTTATHATIFTTKGDISIELFSIECKKTVENFVTHAVNGYYDSVLFHRVVKNFMIQTGDPNGDGTGGTSRWGKDFEDEIRSNLKHDKPFMVSMANTGSPGTNGSQFFITTAACPWLNGKHTLFGRVLKGIEVVKAIEALETDDTDKPKFEDVRIMSIKIS